MKKIISVLVFLIFICSFYNVYAYSLEEYCEFSKNKKILFDNPLYDLSSNSFKLYELIYLGVGEYYLKRGNKVINILDNKKELLIQDISYDVFENYNISLQSDSFPNPDVTTKNPEDFTVINSYKYFQKLKTFPYNSKGECELLLYLFY